MSVLKNFLLPSLFSSSFTTLYLASLCSVLFTTCILPLHLTHHVFPLLSPHSSLSFSKGHMLIMNMSFFVYYQIFESLGEEWITRVISTVKWLVTNSDPDLRLAGIRIMAIIVSFPSVVGNPSGVCLLRATVVTTCNLLAQRESNVNRDRLLASWALANVSSVFELYV